MPTFEYIVKPQGPVLAQFQASWDRCEMIMGPLGSGKTIQSCIKIFTAMCNQAPNKEGRRPSRFYAIRNTFPDLATTTIKDWLSLYEPLGRYTAGGLEPPTHKLRFDLEDGTNVWSEIVFIALDRTDSVKKLRGSQVTGFWLNEIKELQKSVVDMADLRHGRYPSPANGYVKCTWHGMIGDTNAPDDDHWYYKLAEEVKPEGWNFYRQAGGLIPQGEGYKLNIHAENMSNLPDGYYIKGMQGKSKDWIDVNLCNEYGFVKDGKPVYPEYVDTVHCMTDNYIPDPKYPITLGIDFGRTPAASFIQFIPSIGRYIGFDEFTSEDMSAAVFAPELKSYIDRTYPDFTFSRGGGDPSGDQKGQATELTPFKVLHKHGLPVFPVGNNDVLIRRSSIINLLRRLCMDGKPAFMISPKAKMWRKGLAGAFCYKRVQITGEDRYKDEPDKNIYSHICESAEYGLLACGEGNAVIKRDASMASKPVIATPSFNVFD